MTPKPEEGAAPPERLSLGRWSRRKLDAARERQDPVAASAPAAPAAAPEAVAAPAAPAPLPAVETLTPDSDFAAFFQRQGKVDEALKRAALKQLLRDPRFNVMDGLDIYVGDYTQSTPIPEDVLRRLVQARAIFEAPEAAQDAQDRLAAPQAAAAADAVPDPPIEQAPADAAPAIGDGTGKAGEPT